MFIHAQSKNQNVQYNMEVAWEKERREQKRLLSEAHALAMDLQVDHTRNTLYNIISTCIAFRMAHYNVNNVNRQHPWLFRYGIHLVTERFCVCVPTTIMVSLGNTLY